MPGAAAAVAPPAAISLDESDAGIGALVPSGSAQMRRTASAPALRAPAAGPSAPCATCRGACRCLEVYVVSRGFTEFGGPVFKRLTPDMREGLVDMGICHFMTVFRTPEGRFVQFDFGPPGGDVEKTHGPVGSLLRAARRQQREGASAAQDSDATPGIGSSTSSGGSMRPSQSAPALELSCALAAVAESSGGAAAEAAVAAAEVARELEQRSGQRGGEIRERELPELPAPHMYVGRTCLTLEDVRRYNMGHAKCYRLHENDCRHYVNQLVQYATGVEHSTQHLKRHHFRRRFGGRTPWHGWFIEIGQFATDIGNWYRIQAGGAAALLALTGRATVTNIKALAALVHAKGAAGAGAGALITGIPLPPIGPLLRSAQLHVSGAFAAAASAGAPGGTWAAAAASSGGGSAAAASGGFGGFGAFASGLLLAPTAVVAAGLRRPLTSGAMAAAGAGAGAVALGSTTDGGAAASCSASLALRSASANGSSAGAAAREHWQLARVRETVGRGVSGAMLALQRVAGTAPPHPAPPQGGWAFAPAARVSPPQLLGPSTTAATANAAGSGRQLLTVAAATDGAAAGSSSSRAASARPRQPFGGLLGGLSNLGARIAAPFRRRGSRGLIPRRARGGPGNGGVAPAPALASASAAVSLTGLGSAGGSSADLLLLGGVGADRGHGSGASLLSSMDGDGPGGLRRGGATSAQNGGPRMRKSSSCSSIYDLSSAAVAAAAATGHGAIGGNAMVWAEAGGIGAFGGGRNGVLAAAAAPQRLGWVRRGSSNALVLRGA